MNVIRSIFRNIVTHLPWNKYKTIYVEDIPDNPARRLLYLIGNKDNTWLIFFKCPCGCKNCIQLNLMPEDTPRWKFRIKGKRIDIAPSIYRLKGCKSHFWIKRGKVVWAN